MGSSRYRLPFLACLAGLVLGMAWAPCTRAADEKHRFPTIADSIAFTGIGGPLAGFRDAPAILYSPSGAAAAFVTSRGDDTQNENIYTLYVVDHADNFAQATVRVLWQVRTTSSDPGISELTWVDSSNIAVLVREGGRAANLFKLSLETGAVQALTTSTTDVTAYAIDLMDGVTAYMTKGQGQNYELELRGPGGFVFRDQRLTDVLRGQAAANPHVTPEEVYVTEADGTIRRAALEPGEHPRNVGELGLVNAGRYLVIPIMVDKSVAPIEWRRFSYFRPWVSYFTYRIVDLQTGRSERVSSPTLNWRLRYSIARDQQAILDPQIVDLGSGQTDGVPTNFCARISLADPVPVKAADCDLVNDVGKDSSVAEKTRLVSLSEKFDQPPRIVVRRPDDTETRVLLDLNPNLHSLLLGNAREIQWRDRTGASYTGGLITPPDFRVGRHYPLIIQTHGWEPASYLFDGESAAGYAAQVLAGRGFVVAQVPFAKESGPTDEGPANQRMLESLIDRLSSQQLIDKSRVGLQAWSRTGYHVRYMLTHSHYPIAAAVLVDSMNGDYFQLMAEGPSPAALDTYSEMNGGQPFGEGLSLWTKDNPGFRLERIETPLLFIDYDTPLNDWDWFSGLRFLNKPVSLVWLPSSGHWPTRPSDRAATQGRTVDWFCFWMLGQKSELSQSWAGHDGWTSMQRMQTKH